MVDMFLQSGADFLLCFLIICTNLILLSLARKVRKLEMRGG